MSSQSLWLLFPLFVAIASLADIAADLSQGSSTTHLLQEATLLLFSLAVCVWLVWDGARKRRRIGELKREVEAIRDLPPPESAQLVQARRDLSEAIQKQFESWMLTPSEQEIGQFLLKGFSLKEIAQLRGTSEKTIRQQASSIYQKAHLPGRHAFAAWFLEDLL